MKVTRIRQGTYCVSTDNSTVIVKNARIELKRVGRARRWEHVLTGWLKNKLTRFACVVRMATPVEVRTFLDYLGHAWSGVQAALEHLGDLMGCANTLALTDAIEWRAFPR